MYQAPGGPKRAHLTAADEGSRGQIEHQAAIDLLIEND
jgi:hypothetical protein